MLLNQVYQYPDTEERIRVVYEAIDSVWLINIDDESAWPILTSIFDFEELITTQTINSISEPFTFFHIEENSSQSIKRDEAYSFLKILLEEYNELFDKTSRNRIIRKVAEDTSKPRIYYIRQLRRYWQRGMTPNALFLSF